MRIVVFANLARAFDMEKRQHLFSAGVLKPLPPHQTGFYGMGIITDVGVDIQAAEKEIDSKFSQRNKDNAGSDDVTLNIKGRGIGSGTAGQEKLL